MSTQTSIGTPKQLADPNYTPPMVHAIPLGLQHIMAMFISNVTPAIIIAGAAGFGFGSNSPDFPMMIYMIQMSMIFAGVATLIQTIGIGPAGARLPVVQGTSFAFVPIMVPLVAGKGVDAMAAVMGGVVVGGLFHLFLGTFYQENPLCPAAAGDRTRCADDRSLSDQGGHSIRRWRGAGHGQA